MAAYVQKQHATGSGTSASVVFASSVGSGDALVLHVHNDRTTVSSVSGCGATWTKAQSGAIPGFGGDDELWVGLGATSGTTVTVNFTATCPYDILAAEFSGVSAVITSAIATGTSGPTTAAVSATASGQVVFGSIFNWPQNAFTAFTDTPTSAFTTIDNLTDATNGISYTDAYAITTGSGSYSRAGTTSGTLGYLGFGVVLGTAPTTVTGSGTTSVLLSWAAAAHVGIAGAGTTKVPLTWSATAHLDEISTGNGAIVFAWSASATVLIPTTSWVGDDVDQWQVPFLWSATADIEPVEDPPPASDPYIERVSLTMPTPTFVNGRPDDTWVPSVSRSDWGRLQLIINGHDMSRPRGKQFIPLSDSHQDPFGDAEAMFAFPGLTEFDSHSAWNLTPLAPVTMRRKDPAGVFHTLYEGVLGSVEPSTSDGLVIECTGALYRMNLLREPPPLLVQAHDYGDLIAWAFNRKIDRHALNVGRMTHVKTGETGVATSDFQQFLTGAIQDYLSALQALGHQYTIQLTRPRTPRLVVRDTTTTHATVSFGAPGVDCQLSVDFTTATTAVYGSGSNGHCTWMGARFPNLTEQDVPAFPLTVGSVFVAGDGHSGFAPFANFLRRGQYGTIVSDDSYASADVDNVEQFQDRAGITIDGIVGAQTWEAAFQPGANQGSLSGAYIDTIYEYAATRKRTYNAQGADVGANPLFDPSVPRIEDYIPFGDNVSKNLGRRSAKQIMSQAYPAAWTGTITLTSDPAELSRFDLYSGQNIAVENFGGETLLLHITRRERDWKAGSVTLTVDERARDWETVAAIHQRRQDVSDLTRRQKFGRTKSKVFDDYGTWLCEDGAGEIPLMNQQGGFWNVQRVAAAPKGTIARISLAMGSGLTEHGLNQAVAHSISSVPGAARGAVLIFTAPITARGIDSLTGMATPITSLDDGTSPVDHNQDALNALGLIYAAGGPGAAIGFYPNNDPGDGSGTNLTGMFEDGGSVDFGPTGHYWLWIAIWTSTSCKVGGRIFPGAP